MTEQEADREIDQFIGKYSKATECDRLNQMLDKLLIFQKMKLASTIILVPD
jgi:hypothetical protein